MQEAGLTELSYSLYYLYEGICALFFTYSAQLPVFGTLVDLVEEGRGQDDPCLVLPQ